MNIIIDYFQPINKSHIQVAQKLYEKNGKFSVLVSVFHSDLSKRYPIPENLVIDYLELAKDHTDVIVDYFVVNDWNIESLLAKLKGKYFPSVIACTTKRIKDYSLQLEFMLKFNKTSPLKKSILIEVDQNEFGDDLRESLVNVDYSAFKLRTPTFLHNRFKTLVKYYKDTIESVQLDDKNKLSEHFDFFKMVINQDSSVNLKPSLIEVFDNARKRMDIHEEESFFKDLCVSRGFTEHEAVEFIDRVLLKFDQNEIVGFINHLKESIDLDYNNHDILTIGKKVNYNLLKSAIEFRPIKRDNFGSGEFLTSIMFSGAFKANVGDVMIIDKKIEVKNNDSQLLSVRTSNNSPSYAEIGTVTKVLVDSLIKSIEVKSKKKISQSLASKIRLTSSSRKYNISQRGLNSYLDLIQFINKNYKGTEEICTKWFTDIFIGGVFSDNKKFNQVTNRKLGTMLRQALDEEITSKELLCYLTYMSFKYYSKIDKFKGLLLFRSNSKNSKHIKVGYIPNDIDYESYSDIIEPVSGPSVSDPRTSKVFKIRLKNCK